MYFTLTGHAHDREMCVCVHTELMINNEPAPMCGWRWCEGEMLSGSELHSFISFRAGTEMSSDIACLQHVAIMSQLIYRLLNETNRHLRVASYERKIYTEQFAECELMMLIIQFAIRKSFRSRNKIFIHFYHHLWFSDHLFTLNNDRFLAPRSFDSFTVFHRRK